MKRIKFTKSKVLKEYMILSNKLSKIKQSIDGAYPMTLEYHWGH